ncbi:MAG: hypothetical protein LBM01_00555 [Christensenellaceae bacterium]|jgi:hypothetical protein|nr:hypothetical protein [Christensenellaceae bacterium]
MDQIYNEFEYKRFKPKKKFMFPLVAVLLLLAIVALACNAKFHFFKFPSFGAAGSNGDIVSITQTTPQVYAIQVAGVADKTTAMELSRKSKLSGGAGFIVSDGDKFVVIESIYKTVDDANKALMTGEGLGDATVAEREEFQKTFNARADDEHLIGNIFAKRAEVFESLLTFRTEKPSTEELKIAALKLYNEVIALSTALNKMQNEAKLADYSKILVDSNNLALALFALSNTSENLSSSALEFAIITAL